MRLFLRGKNNHKPNTRFPAVIHGSNSYYSKISKRKLKKEYTISSGIGKNKTVLTEINPEF